METIIGHEGVRRELRSLALGPEPPHAILLTGPHGIGRELLAREYAALLNCEAEPEARPCGECRACRLIAERTHPDVVTLGPGDTLCKPRPDEAHEKHPQSRDIRICQVRGLIELVARYPFEGRDRVVVIEPADVLGREASHTILKTLEEPPPHTTFVLITSAPEQLIETIISRCRRIDARIVPRTVIEAGLLARGIEPGLAARAAQEARGRPGRAVAFAAKPDLMGDLDRLLERCAAIVTAPTAERFAYASDLAERWRRDRSLVTGELDAWEVYWERRLRRASLDEPGFTPEETLDALRAIEQARTDLQAQVMTRPALELMLLSFPRGTMDGTPDAAEDEGRPVPHAG
ncbi:MAG TPA: hypothetical protein VFK32_01575 [Tepidiformaceae bacterium]|nr:hypothetical protein [Tepidiformaceae bacterium]